MHHQSGGVGQIRQYHVGASAAKFCGGVDPGGDRDDLSHARLGHPASAKALPHLQKDAGLDWCDSYATSFDAVWNAARAWTDEAEGAHSHACQD